MNDQVNAGLPKPLSESKVYGAVMQGFKDIEAGRYMESTGNWKKDKALFAHKEAKGWL